MRSYGRTARRGKKSRTPMVQITAAGAVSCWIKVTVEEGDHVNTVLIVSHPEQGSGTRNGGGKNMPHARIRNGLGTVETGDPVCINLRLKPVPLLLTVDRERVVTNQSYTRPMTAPGLSGRPCIME